MKKVAGGQTSTGVTVNEKGWGRGIRVLGNNTKFSNVFPCFYFNANFTWSK